MDVYQRRRLVALSVLAGLFIIVVLLIRSCGGDDEAPITALDTGASGATGTSGAPLSQQDFIDTADPICLQANDQLASIDDSDAEKAATDEASIVSGELQQLQTLTLAPDADGEDQLAAYLDALEKQSSALLDLSVAAQRGDDTATSDLQATADSAAADAATAAGKFGFETCGDTTQVSSSGGSGGGGDTSATAPTETPTTTVPAPTTTAPVVPTTPEEATTAPPATDGGGAAPAPTPAPTDDGSSGSSSGGVTP